jgi:hypothetical protein
MTTLARGHSSTWRGLVGATARAAALSLAFNAAVPFRRRESTVRTRGARRRSILYRVGPPDILAGRTRWPSGWNAGI